MTGASVSATRATAAERAAVARAWVIRDPLIAYAISAATEISAALAIGYVTRTGAGGATIPQPSALLPIAWSVAGLLAISAAAKVPTLLAISAAKIALSLLPAKVLPGIVLAIGQRIAT